MGLLLSARTFYGALRDLGFSELKLCFGIMQAP